MPEIQDYDGLAPSNSAAPPSGFPDGALGRQYPSITRELMARVRRWHDDLCGNLRSTGSNGNYVVATSRGVDLARGFSVRFRANHENPAAGPTLSVGSSGQRPFTYADGSTIPAGGVKVGQLFDVSIDNVNNRWTSTLMPGGTTTSGSTTVTGDKLSLTGEAQGSVAIRAGSAWIASAAGTTAQFFRGGSNPGFATVPGVALLACRITPNPTVAVRPGLAHTCTASRTAEGRYALAVTPSLPSGSVALATPGVTDASQRTRVTVLGVTTTTVQIGRLTVSDEYADLPTGQWVDVVVF